MENSCTCNSFPPPLTQNRCIPSIKRRMWKKNLQKCHKSLWQQNELQWNELCCLRLCAHWKGTKGTYRIILWAQPLIRAGVGVHVAVSEAVHEAVLSPLSWWRFVTVLVLFIHIHWRFVRLQECGVTKRHPAVAMMSMTSLKNNIHICKLIMWISRVIIIHFK